MNEKQQSVLLVAIFKIAGQGNDVALKAIEDFFAAGSYSLPAIAEQLECPCSECRPTGEELRIR